MEKFDILIKMIEQVNNENGALEHLTNYDMDFVDDYLGHMELMTVLNMAQYGDFNTNDDYFKFNGYGNLESINHNAYVDEVMDYETEIVQNYVYNFGVDDDLYLEYLELEEN